MNIAKLPPSVNHFFRLSSAEAGDVILFCRFLAPWRPDWPPVEIISALQGGFSMKTAAEYRAMAEECFKWAGEAYTDEVRQSYLQLAQIWLDSASKLDGLPRPGRNQH